MKILAVSDLHGELGDLDFSGQDLVIIAGDFAQLKGRGKWHMYDQKKWVEKKFIPFLGQFPNTQFVIVPGNHDMCFDPRYTFAHKDVNWNIQWPSNCQLLIDRGIDVNGLKIYGTPWVPIISHSWAFEAEHDELQTKFSKIPNDIDILITHSPPRIPDSGIDWSLDTNYGPFGSSELAQAIFMKQPRYVFCGHIHSGDHNATKFENSIIYNVSRLNEDYCIKYKPLKIEIDLK